MDSHNPMKEHEHITEDSPLEDIQELPGSEGDGRTRRQSDGDGIVLRSSSGGGGGNSSDSAIPASSPLQRASSAPPTTTTSSTGGGETVGVSPAVVRVSLNPTNTTSSNMTTTTTTTTTSPSSFNPSHLPPTTSADPPPPSFSSQYADPRGTNTGGALDVLLVSGYDQSLASSGHPQPFLSKGSCSDFVVTFQSSSNFDYVTAGATANNVAKKGIEMLNQAGGALRRRFSIFGNTTEQHRPSHTPSTMSPRGSSGGGGGGGGGGSGSNTSGEHNNSEPSAKGGDGISPGERARMTGVLRETFDDDDEKDGSGSGSGKKKKQQQQGGGGVTEDPSEANKKVTKEGDSSSDEDSDDDNDNDGKLAAMHEKEHMAAFLSQGIQIRNSSVEEQNSLVQAARDKHTTPASTTQEGSLSPRSNFSVSEAAAPAPPPPPPPPPPPLPSPSRRRPPVEDRTTRPAVRRWALR